LRLVAANLARGAREGELQRVGVLVDVLDALLGCGHRVVVDRHDEFADAQAGGGGGGGFDEADDERTLALRVVLSCEPEPPRRLGSEARLHS
jgi:hypothetical protein